MKMIGHQNSKAQFLYEKELKKGKQKANAYALIRATLKARNSRKKISRKKERSVLEIESVEMRTHSYESD
jgi:hypothetical protein